MCEFCHQYLFLIWLDEIKQMITISLVFLNILENNISIATTERQLVGIAHSDPSKYEYHWMYQISRVL